MPSLWWATSLRQLPSPGSCCKRPAAQLKQALQVRLFPLTPYNREEGQWLAWQFHLTDKDEGMIQAFRRGKSETADMTFRLEAFDPDARHRIWDLGQKPSTVVAGRDLFADGLKTHNYSQPGAAVIQYARER